MDFIKNAMGEIKRAFVFTRHSIEQVEKISADWFSAVANIAESVSCVHLEPFGFQMKSLGKISDKHRDIFEENGWNANFASAIKTAQAQGSIIIDDIILEIGYSKDALNPGSLAIWHSNKEKTK